jgi:hypothetical protein
MNTESVIGYQQKRPLAFSWQTPQLSNGHRKGLSPSSLGEYERILWDFYNFCVQCGGPDLEVKDIPQYAVPFLVERNEERNFAVATWTSSPLHGEFLSRDGGSSR